MGTTDPTAMGEGLGGEGGTAEGCVRPPHLNRIKLKLRFNSVLVPMARQSRPLQRVHSAPKPSCKPTEQNAQLHFHTQPAPAPPNHMLYGEKLKMELIVTPGTSREHVPEHYQAFTAVCWGCKKQVLTCQKPNPRTPHTFTRGEDRAYFVAGCYKPQ